MKAFELNVRLTEEGDIELPDELADLLRTSKARMLLLLESPDEEADWARLSREGFVKGYSDVDAIYDTLD